MIKRVGHVESVVKWEKHIDIILAGKTEKEETIWNKYEQIRE
jgi:hypothetical protein